MKLSLALLQLLLASVVFSDDEIDIDYSSLQDSEAIETDVLNRYVATSSTTTTTPATTSAKPIPPTSPTPPKQTTHWDTIPVGSPEAWYPMMLDVAIGYYTHWLKNYIRMNQIVKERLIYQRQLLSQIPPFFDGINLYYDGDHLHSILTRNAELDSWVPSTSSSGRNLNYTVPRPVVAMEVIDTVKAIMGGLQNVNN